MPHSTDFERLAIVDENDQVVGSGYRRDIHANGLRHRAVHVLIEHPDGRILLQKRSRMKDVNPGAWDTSAAGHVDFGESYEDAAYREVQEELGFTPQWLTPVGRLDAAGNTGWEFVQVYCVSHAGPFRHNSHEIEALSWFEPAEIINMIESGRDITRSFQGVWQLFRGFRPPRPALP